MVIWVKIAKTEMTIDFYSKGPVGVISIVLLE